MLGEAAERVSFPLSDANDDVVVRGWQGCDRCVVRGSRGLYDFDVVSLLAHSLCGLRVTGSGVSWHGEWVVGFEGIWKPLELAGPLVSDPDAAQEMILADGSSFPSEVRMLGVLGHPRRMV